MRHLGDSLKVIPEGFKNETKSTKFAKMNSAYLLRRKKGSTWEPFGGRKGPWICSLTL
jgi:hypothetical protein